MNNRATRKGMLVIILLLPLLGAVTSGESRKKVPPVDTVPIPGDRDIAVMETTMGTIEIELFGKETAKTVRNFEGLARSGYYDGIIFHRVIDNFMIQCGDPTGTGMGGESIYGPKFEDEIVPTLTFDKPGLIAMANAGPGTNGSQFFLTLVATPWLNGRHTIFGRVVKGFDVVQAIGKVQTSKPGDRPMKEVSIRKIAVKKQGQAPPRAKPEKR